jgi:cytochrome c553
LAIAIRCLIAGSGPLLPCPLDAQDVAALPAKAAVCAACHGRDGNSTNPEYPILAGQSWRYIYIELKDFKEGRRSNPPMASIVAELSSDDMIALGNYFATQKQAPIKITVDDRRVKAGAAKAAEVLCTMCHLGGFVGQNEIPRVAGQWPQYIKKQLEDFKARRRTNDGGNMTAVAATLSDDDIENLAEYVGNLD